MHKFNGNMKQKKRVESRRRVDSEKRTEEKTALEQPDLGPMNKFSKSFNLHFPILIVNFQMLSFHLAT